MFTSSQISKHLKPAQKDFVVLCTVAIIALVIAVGFDVFDRFAHWYVKQKEPWEVEEVLVAIFVLSFCFAIFSYRRWKELILEVQEREKIEKVLREQTESLKTLMDTIPNPIFYTDVDGKYTGCNKAFEDFIGKSRHDILGKKVHDMYTSADIAEVCKIKDDELYQNPGRQFYEWVVENREGELRNVIFHKATLSDPGERMTGIVGIVTDITERKKSELALAEESARRRILLEQSRDGIVVLDKNCKVFEANSKYAEMLGYTMEEVRDLYAWDWDAQWTREELEEQVGLVDGSGDFFETRHRRKDGTILDVEISTNGAVFAEQKLVFCVCRDITERKRVEEALRESELKYRSVVENIQDVFYRVDAEGRLALISTSAAQILGYDSVDDLVGQRSEILWADPSKRLALLDELDRCGHVREWEFEAICRNGSVLLAAATVHLIHDDNGNPIGYEGIWRDITAHKRAKDQIWRANEYLENVFENSPDGIGIVDSDGKFIKWNRMAAEMYGYTFEEVRGKSFLELYADQDNLDRMLGELRRNGSVKKYEINMKKKDGSVFSAELSISILKGDENRTLGSVCVARDQSELRKALQALEASNKRLQLEITERTRVEEALRVSQQIIEGIIYSAPVRVFWKDKNLTYLGCNAMFAHDAGFTDPKDIIGKDDSQMVWRDQAELYCNDDREVIEKDCSKLLIEEPQTTPEGNTITLLTNKIPLRGHKGEIIGVLGTYMDITERKLAEEEKAKIELQSQQLQKAESLGRMAGSIAHHFNNLLGAVIGNLELALDDLPRESDARESILESLKASRRAAEISRLMLAYLGQTTVRKEPLDLVEAIRETLPLLAASVPQEVRFNTQLPPDGPIILADGVHIKQILTNLVTNAVEAIDESAGEITLSILSVSKAEMQGLRFNPMDWEPKADSYACLLVADRGCGMDELTREKIFDPFFSTKFTGRGLGLAVVLGLVRAHDGAITVESSFGGGAVFRVFLPLATRVLPSLQEEPFVSTPMKDAGLVLLVDDEPMMRNMAQAMLKRKLGYEVITASDGYEAVEIFRACRDEIKLVLLDLSMPGMNGWETLAALRTLRSDIPVVLASGYDEAQVMQGDHPDRPQAFIHKPYQSKDLQAAIEAALRRPVNR